jgi:tetratricopeptide (TPR) repeat protein
MRYFLLFIILISSLSFSQIKNSEKNDSVTYYLDLVKFNKRSDNYRNCLEYSQKALDYANKTNNQKAIADSYSNLGNIYLELKKIDDAIDVYIKSIAVYATLPISSEQAFTHYSIGICYMEKNNFAMADKNFITAGTFYEKMKISSASEMLNLQKGIIYIEKNRSDLAMPLLENIISKKDTTDFNKTKSEALFQIGRIEIEKKRYNLANNYFLRALATNKNNLEQKSNIVLALSNSFEKSMNIEKSHDYLKQYVALKDSISAINNKKIGINDFASFKSSEKLKSIEQIDKEN